MRDLSDGRGVSGDQSADERWGCQDDAHPANGDAPKGKPGANSGLADGVNGRTGMPNAIDHDLAGPSLASALR